MWCASGTQQLTLTVAFTLLENPILPLDVILCVQLPHSRYVEQETHDISHLNGYNHLPIDESSQK